MIVQCDKCRTKFRIADGKVTAAGVKVRCSRCAHVFMVKSTADDAQPASLPPPPSFPDVGGDVPALSSALAHELRSEGLALHAVPPAGPTLPNASIAPGYSLPVPSLMPEPAGPVPGSRSGRIVPNAPSASSTKDAMMALGFASIPSADAHGQEGVQDGASRMSPQRQETVRMTQSRPAPAEPDNFFDDDPTHAYPGGVPPPTPRGLAYGPPAPRPISNPFGSAQGSAPFGSPQGSAPFASPQGSAPFGSPQGSGPFGSPQGSAPFGSPQGSGPFGSPQGSAPFGTSQGSGPFGSPKSPLPGPGPMANPPGPAFGSAQGSSPFGTLGGQKPPTSVFGSKGGTSQFNAQPPEPLKSSGARNIEFDDNPAAMTSPFFPPPEGLSNTGQHAAIPHNGGERPSANDFSLSDIPGLFPSSVQSEDDPFAGLDLGTGHGYQGGDLSQETHSGAAPVSNPNANVGRIDLGRAALPTSFELNMATTRVAAAMPLPVVDRESTENIRLRMGSVGRWPTFVGLAIGMVVTVLAVVGPAGGDLSKLGPQDIVALFAPAGEPVVAAVQEVVARKSHVTTYTTKSGKKLLVVSGWALNTGKQELSDLEAVALVRNGRDVIDKRDAKVGVVIDEEALSAVANAGDLEAALAARAKTAEVGVLKPGAMMPFMVVFPEPPDDLPHRAFHVEFKRGGFAKALGQ